MRCLIDTNIFLEVLLNQENASQARALLQKSDIHELFMSDFSLHSIILILLRRKASELAMLFLADTAQSGSVGILRIIPGDFPESLPWLGDTHSILTMPINTYWPSNTTSRL